MEAQKCQNAFLYTNKMFTFVWLEFMFQNIQKLKFHHQQNVSEEVTVSTF